MACDGMARSGLSGEWGRRRQVGWFRPGPWVGLVIDSHSHRDGSESVTWEMHILLEPNLAGQLKEIGLALAAQEAVGGGRHGVWGVWCVLE